MATEATNGDVLVLRTQEWLNDTYGNDSRYNVIQEDGRTGWATIYALTRALQIELGITNTSNNFGPTTISRFNTKYPTGIHQQSSNDDTEDNVYAIIQGALFCKGYSTGLMNITKHFYNGTGNAIKNLREDAGIDNSTSTVTLNIMKALMSMDYFYSYDTSERTTKIISMQRYLNANYENYIGLTPCDGIYSRGTSKAIIFAIQAEEQMPTSKANGNCGDATKKCLPNIPYSGGYLKNGTTYGISYTGQTYTSSQIDKFKILANMALYFNGFGDGNITTTLDSLAINEFQSKYSIPVTGNINYTTWLSLLISCGDQDRTAIACDCATIITNSNINVLLNNNYSYIGRYLSGTVASGESKALSKDELQLLFSNNIRLFPIHQRSANSINYFTLDNAEVDAQSAAQYADILKLQFGAIIYFAVDCDATNAQITNLILPYFERLYSKFITESKGKYRVGVYGTRNVCNRVCNAGYACSSFVSDMSTGYSGNLGFLIPDNWALDQFAGTTISSGGQSINIDKDGFSGNYTGISQEYYDVDNNEYDGSILEGYSRARLLINTGSPIPVYASKTYVLPEYGATTPNRETTGGIIGYINSYDFYIRYPLYSQIYDNVHRVMFNDGVDVKIGYITERSIFNSYSNPRSDEAVEAQILPAQDAFTCYKYNFNTNSYALVPQSSDEHDFTINQNVPYFNSDGTYGGTLQKGDTIRIHHDHVYSVGFSRQWCQFVDEIKRKGNSEFETFNKHVSVGLEYGNLPSNRAFI